MTLNPEFQRQLYLECSQARLVGIPLVLGIIFTFTYFIDGYRLGEASAHSALTLFLLVTLLWGSRQTVDSILDECRERTWDNQRLSALSAWELAWGKLAGSTVMVWYAGGICLAVFSLATNNPGALPSVYFYGIVGALMLQSACLLLGVLAMQGEQNKSSASFLLALLGFIYLFGRLFDLANSTYEFDAFLPKTTTAWYQWHFTHRDFEQTSLLLTLAWCLVGNYRLLGQALGIRYLPWIWLSFVVFLVVYLGGFLPALPIMGELLPSFAYTFELTAFAVTIALSYLGIIIEQNEAIRLSRLVRFIQQGRWRHFAEELPLWWLTLGLSLPFAFLLALSEASPLDIGKMLHFYPMAIVLLLVRDCGLYLYFSFGKQPQRALSLSLLVAALLYGILPGMFSTVGMTSVSALFFPIWADSQGSALVFGGLQCLVVGYLLMRRWQQSVGMNLN